MKTCSQFSKFFIVGVCNAVIDFTIFNLLALGFGLVGFNYIIIKMISFLAATGNSFFWNKKWVFKKKGKIKKKNTFLFLLISGAGLLINTFTANFIFQLLSQHLPTLPVSLTANIGVTCGIAIIILWNFCGYKYIVFKS